MSKVREKGLLSEIMTSKVVTIGLDEFVEEALRLMIKFDVGSVIVVDKLKPVGIITERDVTRVPLRGDSLLRLPVKSLMSRPLQAAAAPWRILYISARASLS